MDRPRARPPYPTLSPSQTSSAYTSSSSLASMPSPIRAPQDQAFTQQSAPLPSPTTEQRHYGNSFHQSTTTQPRQQQQQQQQQEQAQQQPRYNTRSSSSSLAHLQAASQMASQQPQMPALMHQQQHQQQQQMQTGVGYVPDRQGAGTTNAQTMAMLAEYNLVAEAAKRAQVACMIRDLDEMEMS